MKDEKQNRSPEEIKAEFVDLSKDSSRKKHDPKVAPHETKIVNLNEIKFNPELMFEVHREGVFVHGFECQHCGLHFNVYSWQINRHRVDNTYCPECGKQGAFVHYRCVLSEDPNFDVMSLQEIYQYVPFPGSQVMDDTVVRKTPGK